MTNTENQERIAVKRERDAFARGRCMSQHEMHEDESAPCTACWQRSVELYPMPKVQRPRVVKDSANVYWRVIGGGLEWSHDRAKWRPASDENNQRMFLTTERIALLSPLLANPTEEVEADD